MAEHPGSSEDAVRPGEVERAESQAFFPVEHCMTIGEKEIVIRPLVLGQFRRMVGVLAEFVGALAAAQPTLDLDNLSDIGGNAQLLVTVAAGQITPLIAALTALEPEYIEDHMTIPEVARFLRLTLEVNELPQVVEDFCIAARLVKRQVPLIQQRMGGKGSGAALLTS